MESSTLSSSSKKVFLRTSLCLASISCVHAFPIHSNLISHPITSMSTHAQNDLSVLFNSRDNFLLDDAIVSAENLLVASRVAATSFTATSSLNLQDMDRLRNLREALNNPRVESEILSDIAHLGLDLFTFVTPEKWLLRLASVIGRLCSIAADYLPDHTINLDEAIFQGIMLFISCFLLAQSTFPLAVAGLSKIARNKVLDKKMFSVSEKSSKPSESWHNSRSNSTTSTWRNVFAWHYLFKPAGMSLFQFHCLSSLEVIDWIDVKPHTVLVEKEEESHYLYWMYKGSADIIFNGQPIEYLSTVSEGTKSKARQIPLNLFADMDFLCELETRKEKQKSGAESEIPLSCKLRNKALIRSGIHGSRLLRLKKSKLIELMNIDPDLNDIIHNLLVKGMQNILEVLLSTEKANSAFQSIPIKLYETTEDKSSLSYK